MLAVQAPHRFSPRFLLLLLILMMALLLTSTSIQAQQVPLAVGDSFGRAVAIDGDTALIGAGDGIHIFVRSGTTWAHQARLDANDGTPLMVGDVDGDTAAGFKPSFNDQGSVIVFVRSGTSWTQQAKLTINQDDYPETDLSGPVVIAGDRLLFGALDRSMNADKPRFRVFAYNRVGTTWVLEVQFDPSGYSIDNDIALDGNLAVIFNENYTYGYDPGGSFGVYDHSGSNWTYVTGASVLPGDPALPDTQSNVKSNVSISGNTIASGGYVFNYDDYDGTINGIYEFVFIFTLNGTTLAEQARLRPVNNQGNFYDIIHVALDGDTLLMSVRDPDTTRNLMLAYVRNGTTWTQQAVVTEYQLDGYYSYSGRPFAFSGDTVLVGVESEGATYAYVRNGTTWSLQQVITLEPQPGELLVNGGFEAVDPNNSDRPLGWKLKPAGSLGYLAVQRDCELVVHSGFCALKFYSSVNKAIQNVDLNTHQLKAGDKIKLSGFYNKLSTNNYVADVWLYISYANLPNEQGHITVQKPTNGWKELPKISATLKDTPTRVRVVIQAAAYYNQLIYFDDISLKLITPELKLARQQADQELELLPLPLPPESEANLTRR